MKQTTTLLSSLLIIGAMCFAASSTAQCGITLQFNVTNPDCGASNGAIDMVVSGGSPPYYIYWGDGPTTEDRSGLAAGTYTVDVYDNTGSGCVTKGGVTVDCKPVEICQFRTQTQGGWGAPPNGGNPAMYLQNHFASCFPNGITIGCTNKLKLTTSTAVKDFLPSGSTPSMLPAGTLTNPGGAYNNVLAGQLVAAVINVTVDACDPAFGASAGWLGDAYFVDGVFIGSTVQQLIDEANSFIGGCGGTHSASQYNDALTIFNQNYHNGTINNGHLACKKKDKSMTREAAVSGLTIYPNPAADKATLGFVADADGAVEFTLIDLTGRTIADLGKVEPGIGAVAELNVDLSRVQDGTYLVLATQNGATSMQRLVVNH